jgi:hypothetical protein
MTVTPDDCNRIVTLLHHVSWVHVLRNFLDLENLSSVDLIDTTCTLTLYSQLVGINALFNLAVVRDENTCRCRIIVDLLLIWLERLNFLVNFLSDLIIKLNNRN